VRLTVKILSQGAEPFLACSVPDFDLKVMVVYLKRGVYVIDTNGFNMIDVDLATMIHFKQ
jgi:hypothetical protein